MFFERGGVVKMFTELVKVPVICAYCKKQTGVKLINADAVKGMSNPATHGICSECVKIVEQEIRRENEQVR